MMSFSNEYSNSLQLQSQHSVAGLTDIALHSHHKQCATNTGHHHCLLKDNFTHLLQIWPCCIVKDSADPIAALIAAMLLLLFAHICFS